MPAAEAALYAAAALMAGSAAVWAWLLGALAGSGARTPRLDEFGPHAGAPPRVSVILPARNEEAYIGRCLRSLLGQDYPDFEVVAVDDSSGDGTGRIIRDAAGADPRVVHVSARPKPDGWTGKNWACAEGYRRASGELLLFTDADTRHGRSVMSLAVGHLESAGLDALTVMPRMLCPDAWARITLPVISVFMHTRFSAARVNDPSKKTGYFFGSFFVMRREAYEAVGTHAGVRGEIIEDGALGCRVKESGRPMRMAAGGGEVEAVWARDLPTLWNGLKRLMVPLYLRDRRTALGVFSAVLLLLFAPFALLAASAAALAAGAPAAAGGAALLASLAASCGAWAGAAAMTRALRICPLNAAAAPAGGLIVVLGFLAGIVRAGGDGAVAWRGRRYSASDHAGAGPMRV